MGIARSTYYDQPVLRIDDTALVETMAAIADSFEAYGYRRMQVALRHRGLVVNHKKVRRLMREHDLQPRQRRRYIATTDGDHDLPIFPNLAKNMTPNGPNQLWVADITYVAIIAGFVYVAVILGRLVAQGRRLRHRPLDRRPADARCAAISHRTATAPARLRASYGPRVAIRGRSLSADTRRVRLRRIHGPPRQSLRQRQGRELYEDAQG